jgi:dehydrogenase/reductase SDR family protein 12
MKARDLAKIVTFYGRFIPTYSRIGYEARCLTWPERGGFDFGGQCWLVTGASQGIGRALTQAAALAGARVIAVARTGERLRELANELPADAAARVTVREQDLSLQSGVEALLDWLRENAVSLDVLVNNVGLLLNKHSLTRDGREVSFATNLLGHFQLTEGLLDEKRLARNAVIINMSSGGLYNAPLGIKLLNVTEPAGYNGKVAYAYAKRAQVALADYWDERIRKIGGRAYVMHPGWVKTPGVETALPVFWKIQKSILRTPYQGADTALWLASRRPDSAPETVWFDRAPRSAHMNDSTLKAECNTMELVDYLARELTSGKAELPPG